MIEKSLSNLESGVPSRKKIVSEYLEPHSGQVGGALLYKDGDDGEKIVKDVTMYCPGMEIALPKVYNMHYKPTCSNNINNWTSEQVF